MSIFNRRIFGVGLVAPLVLAGCGGGGHDGSAAAPPTPTNQSPAVATVADQTVDQDDVLGPLDLTVGDAETPADALTITARAADPSLLPDGSIEISGTGAERTMFVVPAADRSGTTNVVVEVADAGGARSTATFAVNVHPLFPGEASGWVREVVIPRAEFDTAVGEDHADGTPLTGVEDIPRIKFTDNSADDPTAYEDLLPPDGEQVDDN